MTDKAMWAQETNTTCGACEHWESVTPYCNFKKQYGWREDDTCENWRPDTRGKKQSISDTQLKFPAHPMMPTRDAVFDCKDKKEEK